MGKGDKKTKRGKIINGSYGKKRLRKNTKSTYIAPKVVK
jgi:30S ribosomal protein S31